MPSSLIEVSDVRKSFGSVEVLHGISFRLEEPKIFGLLGPSGAGKTTVVRMLCGIDEPTTGTVKLWDKPMPSLALMERTGYMAQADALYTELTARENLEFFGSLYGLRGQELRQRLTGVMDLVGLSDDLDKLVSNYSGGMKRRLSLAAAMIHDPELLILDEPTVGIDPVLRHQVWNEFDNLRDRGIPVVITTHVMDEAERCDELAMLRNGSLIATGSPAELKEQTGCATLEDAFLYYGGVRA